MIENKPIPVLSYTSRCTNISYVLPTTVLVESAIELGISMKISAIWDTGAMCSLIRPEVADKLSLKPVSKQLMSTPSGKGITNVYLINMALPNNAKIVNIKALEGIPSNCDMLIGMDVITLGDFAVSNFDGCTMFSFRIPSMMPIDFHNAPFAVKE